MTRWLLGMAWMATGCVDKPPAAPALTISPKSPTSVDDLVATVWGQSDATVVYRWYRDHELQDDLSEDRVSAEHTVRGEIWTAIVALKEDGVEGVPVGGDVEIGNAAPSVTVSMPETVETGGTITPHVVVSDPDDPSDTVTLSYLWANDANVDTYDTKSITIPGETGLATVWTLTTTPTDPQGLAGTPTDTSTTVVYGDPAQPVAWTIALDESCAGDISATHHDWEYVGGKETIGAAIVDLNGDDWLDMMWFNQLDQNALAYINGGPDAEYTVLEVQVGRPSGKGAFGDLNADGLIDVVVSNRGWTDASLGTLSIVRGDDASASLFSAPVTISEPARPNSLVLLDVDGDGVLDLLMDQDDADEERCVSFRRGADNASFEEAECVIDGRWDRITAFDPDGDGQPGLVGYGIVGGQYGAHFFEIDSGNISDPKYIELPDLFADISLYDPVNVRGFDVTDVNLDGLDDLLIWFESGSAGLQLVQLTNEGGLRFTACELASDIPHAIYAAGDLNKDGVADVLASTLVAYENSTYHVYLSKGDATDDTGTGDTGEIPTCLGSSIACPATSCREIREADASTVDGVYWLGDEETDAFEAYCDMSTDDGGWLLLYSYNHAGGENPSLDADTLPLSVDAGFSHTGTSSIGYPAISDVRFYCETAEHGRIIHFKTSNAHALAAAENPTGSHTWSPVDWSSDFTELAGHTGNLPASADGVEDSESLTHFPFYTDSLYHWGIRALEHRWECDGNAETTGSGFQFTTTHQIWVR